MKVFILSSLLIPTLTMAHGGRLNSEGCHKQDTGSHCHKQIIEYTYNGLPINIPGDMSDEDILKTIWEARRSTKERKAVTCTYKP